MDVECSVRDISLSGYPFVNRNTDARVPVDSPREQIGIKENLREFPSKMVLRQTDVSYDSSRLAQNY